MFCVGHVDTGTKECGALLIDLGAGTSSYLVYHDGLIADVGVLAVGGDHVTNDIAMGFNLPMKRAESLKKKMARRRS